MIIVGLDPGFSGAWGAIDSVTGQYEGCGDFYHDSNILHIDLIWDDILYAIHKRDFCIVIESVHTMKGQGIASSGKFMKSFGQLIAMSQLARSADAWHFVSPQKWKRDLGLSRDKEDSLKLARTMWPDAPLTRKKDNGRAEALLIAGWHAEQML